MAKKLNEGLIVSCQALPDEPLYGGDTIVKMAYAAQLGGATGIRCLVEDIDSIIAKTEGKLPIIGLVKQCYPDSDILSRRRLKRPNVSFNPSAISLPSIARLEIDPAERNYRILFTIFANIRSNSSWPTSRRLMKSSKPKN